LVNVDERPSLSERLNNESCQPNAAHTIRFTKCTVGTILKTIC